MRNGRKGEHLPRPPNPAHCNCSWFAAGANVRSDKLLLCCLGSLAAPCLMARRCCSTAAVRDPRSRARLGRGDGGARHAHGQVADVGTEGRRVSVRFGCQLCFGQRSSLLLIRPGKPSAEFDVPPHRIRIVALWFCCPRRRFGEFRRPFAPYEDPSRRPPKTDEVHLPIACKRTAPAAPAARARASTVWHLQPAQHIAMTACALLGRITLVGPVHHGLFGAIAV